MEASAATVVERTPVLEQLTRPLRGHPGRTALGVIAVIALLLIVGEGLQPWAQRSVNGLVAGSYFALGAVGLTLVYGILRLTNFAHGDMLTFGAYVALLFSASLGLPFVLAVVCAVAGTALLGVLLEVSMLRPMRDRRAGTLQLLLLTIGIAFLLRNTIQFIAGADVERLDVDTTSSLRFIGLRIGETELIVVIVAAVVLVGVALMLRHTLLGKQMRALSDDIDLAETTGIDTGRIVIATWILAGGLAGLAGTLYGASVGSITPQIGFSLLLALFAAVVLGGIGNAYGALAGGLVLGLAQEWSTLLVEARWKVLVGFVILIIVLVVRPQGIFGQERTL